MRRSELEEAYFVEHEWQHFSSIEADGKRQAGKARFQLRSWIKDTWHRATPEIAEGLPMHLPPERWTLGELEAAFVRLGGNLGKLPGFVPQTS